VTFCDSAHPLDYPVAVDLVLHPLFDGFAWGGGFDHPRPWGLPPVQDAPRLEPDAGLFGAEGAVIIL
jgi:hypothetical protein